MRVAALKVAALLYFVGEEHLYALLVGQDGRQEKFDLGDWAPTCKQIDTLWEALEGGFSPRRAVSLLRDFCFNWGKQLLPPPVSLRPFDVLVIVPHHALHGLPIHAIWIEESRQFLAASHGVTYCSSCTLLARCMDRNVARRAPLTEWEFSREDGGHVDAPALPRLCLSMGIDVIGDKTQQYANLASTFARSFNEHFMYNPASRAIKIRLKGEKRGDAVCIVSHGYFDPDVSENSGLLLGMEFGTTVRPIHFGPDRFYHFRDLPFRYLPPAIGNRRAAELMTMGELKVDCETEAQLVALFACSTGAGQVLSGDDFNSLAYQWLKTGAASVLANLWELDIDFAVAWAPVFLRNWLVKRQPKAIAYQEAIRQVLAQNPQPDPFEWATMALFGDWL